ncbi:hypothetical protein AS188_07880 [Kocuria flava]|nr:MULTISPECIES: hypothetical protein [Kocuria]ALU39684.1 hypothetical protein AS188_07880 [Kocuria flava]
MPFELGDQPLRAGLNVYCDRPHAFDSDAILALQDRARAASTALGSAVRSVARQVMAPKPA